MPIVKPGTVTTSVRVGPMSAATTVLGQISLKASAWVIIKAMFKYPCPMVQSHNMIQLESLSHASVIMVEFSVGLWVRWFSHWTMEGLT